MTTIDSKTLDLLYSWAESVSNALEGFPDVQTEGNALLLHLEQIATPQAPEPEGEVVNDDADATDMSSPKCNLLHGDCGAMVYHIANAERLTAERDAALQRVAELEQKLGDFNFDREMVESLAVQDCTKFYEAELTRLRAKNKGLVEALVELKAYITPRNLLSENEVSMRHIVDAALARAEGE